MHTVVLGWFGVSAVWFLVLFWRLVKSALPSGGGLRGPGTIRLWLGFACVLIASCTLEAALASSATDAFGHALAAGFGHVLGRIGTPLAMLALWLVSVPWLVDFGWGSAIRWANTAFGLGLPLDGTPRQDAARGRRAAEAPQATAASVNPMAPKSTGRYARPTVWRPPAVSRGASGTGGTGGTSGAASGETRGGAFDGAPANAAAGAQATAFAARADRGAASAASTASAVSAERTREMPASSADAWMPVEPTAPAGWLRDPAAAVRNPAATAAASGARAPRADAPARAGDRSSPTASAPAAAIGALAASSDAAARVASAAVPAARAFAAYPATPAKPVAATPPKPADAARRDIPPRSSSAPRPAAPRPVARSYPVTAQRPTDYPRAVPQTPPASVQDTLRAIEENTAQWRKLAGASLARRGNATQGAVPSDAVAPAPAPAPASAQTPASTEAEAQGLASANEAFAASALDSAGGGPISAASHALGTTPAQAEVRAETPVETAQATESTTDAQTEPDDTVATGDTERAHSTGTDTPAAEIAAPSDIADTAAQEAEPAVESGLAAPAGTVREITAAEKPPEATQASPDSQPAPDSRTPAETSIGAETGAASTPSADTILAAQPATHPAPADAGASSGTTASQLPRESATPSTTTVPSPAATPAPRWATSITFDGLLPPGGAPTSRPAIAAAEQRTDAHAPATRHDPTPFAAPLGANAVPAPSVAPLGASATPAPSAAPSGANAVPAPSTAPWDASAPPAPSTAPSDTNAAPRTALRGHTPTEFEFHAPAASAVELPTLDLLERASPDIEPIPEARLAETGQLIEQRLQEFKVPVTVVGASAGPVITRFEVEPALGVRGSQIVGLMKDLSRGLGLTSIRVVETIPGKTCMGLELPNAKRHTIRLSEILEAGVYQNSASRLTLAMGKDIIGNPVVTDLAKAPHMLVAGTTGSGKSVAINAMIVSLLYKATPEDVRLIMIDPKMLELSVYEGIPHLLAPVVTDMKLAANALNWCVGEMEKRYRLMSAVGVRNLAGFNQKVRDGEASGKKLTNPFSLTPDAPEPLSTLPLIVVVIDELADLMMVAGKKIEELIARLAQKARAAGIHLILATQRPSVDVITGLIKANIPTRVAFQVSSKIDSRTILDQMGAESLLGQGDMLFLPPGTGYPQRVHGAFVADEEVHRIVEHLKQFGEPHYEDGILDGPASEGVAQDLFGDAPDPEADPLYDEAVAFVVRTRRASISSVQRQLRIGYNRAARLVEQMEAAGLVSSMGINGSREVLAPGPAE